MSPHDAVASLYRPMAQGVWKVRRWGSGISLRGYWSPARPVSGAISLDRGSGTWMSLMPVEVESQQTGVDCASGHVAVFGLGLRWAAALCALRAEVEAVTVVERDPGLIALHRYLDLFDRLPGGAGAMVRIVEADAFVWSPDRVVDLLAADIWLPIVGGDRVAEVRRMQANVGATRVYFWGQELRSPGIRSRPGGGGSTTARSPPRPATSASRSPISTRPDTPPGCAPRPNSGRGELAFGASAGGVRGGFSSGGRCGVVRHAGEGRHPGG
jgi:hypothetical protein